jgi:hypothetical protein
MITFVHSNTIHVHFSWKKSYRHPADLIKKLSLNANNKRKKNNFLLNEVGISLEAIEGHIHTFFVNTFKLWRGCIIFSCNFQI